MNRIMKLVTIYSPKTAIGSAFLDKLLFITNAYQLRELDDQTAAENNDLDGNGYAQCDEFDEDAEEVLELEDETELQEFLNDGIELLNLFFRIPQCSARLFFIMYA